jgi:methylenetetrahydrofolate dehydrogenase (NADP+) / methenyltetrahydrofolate cyclohydrolase
MSANIIDGKAFASELRSKITTEVALIKAKYHVTPGLAVVLIGEDPASHVYVRNKGKMTVEAGMNSFDHRLPADATREQILAKVNELNADPAVHGILVQLPLPRKEDETIIINAIHPDKDVDGFHAINVGKLTTGQDGMVPCTPLGCLMLLKHELGDLAGRHAVVVGRSNIVGKPMASLLLQADCTVTVVHSKTQFIKEHTRRADILVAALGKAEVIDGDWLESGGVIIDVGINRITQADGNTRLVGDVHFEEAMEIAAAVTPVPGGVGPMTIACLLFNTLKATCQQHNIPFALHHLVR